MTRDEADLWVFGYGSLMWRPGGFPYDERRDAHLSWLSPLAVHLLPCPSRHAGKAGPGPRPRLRRPLPGSRGYRVAAEEAAETVRYLREREQVTTVYRERRLPVRLEDGRGP